MTRQKRREELEAYEQMERRKTIHAYWVHQKKKNEHSVTGYFILPSCICSNCGYFVQSEREKCPKCRAVMDAEPKKK